MSTIHIAHLHQNWPEYTAHCDNCGTSWPAEKLKGIVDAEQRLTPGEETPAGQCPGDECGALCFPLPGNVVRMPKRPNFKQREQLQRAADVRRTMYINT